MLRFLVPVSLLFVLCGCMTPTKPRTVMSVSPGGESKVRRATFNGQYQLFAMQTDAGEGAPDGEPLATHRLRRGQTFGFRSDVTGLRAVAGNESIPLARGRYFWEMRADKGQVDGPRTVTVVAIVGGTALFMVLVASAAPF